MSINPMEDWVPGKFPDRRTPSQDEIALALNAYREEVSASRKDRENASAERAQMRIDIKALVVKVEHLEERVEPIFEVLIAGRVMRWIFFGLIATVVGVASAWGAIKIHFMSALKP